MILFKFESRIQFFTLIVLTILLSSTQSFSQKDSIRIHNYPDHKGREVVLQDSMMVNTDILYLYFWDQGVVDGDKIKVSKFELYDGVPVNEKTVCKNIDLKKKKLALFSRNYSNCPIALSQKGDTYLRIDAIDMGRVRLFNTAYLKFLDRKGLHSRNYSLDADEEKSALFKLIYNGELDSSFEDYNVNSAEETIISLDTIYINIKDTEVKVIAEEFIGKKIEVALVANNKKVYKTKVGLEVLVPIIEYAEDSNTIIIKPTKDFDVDSLSLSIISSLSNINSKILLTQNTQYEIPVIIEQRKASFKQIQVASEDIEMKIRDSDKEDGDRVSIMQGDSYLLTDHELSSAGKKFSLTLNKEGVTELLFFPIQSKGGINTAEVIIYEGGIETHRFKLNMFLKNRPAKVLIEYVDY